MSRGKALVLDGMRFGRLLVLGKGESNRRHSVFWRCACDCGNEKLIAGPALAKGLTRSCGCLKRERFLSLFTTHGKSNNSRAYKIWSGMKGRCNNKNSQDYPNYGGRGIRVCDEWSRFEQFLEDMGEPPTAKHQIDRIDNNGHYEPGNCRWSTNAENSRNRRSTILIERNGETLCLTDWCAKLGLPFHTIKRRIHRGWQPERALTTPIHGREQLCL